MRSFSSVTIIAQTDTREMEWKTSNLNKSVTEKSKSFHSHQNTEIAKTIYSYSKAEMPKLFYTS